MTPTEVERDNDSLCTPEWILERVRKVHPIGLDPCGNPWSTVGARITASKHNGENGLRFNWADLRRDEAVWVNPPYSDPMPWCTAIAAYWREDAAISFALVKNDPSTKWSAVLRSVRTAQCDFTKRIKFAGGTMTGTFASTLFYVGPSPYLFCHVFQDVGDVRVFR